MSVVVGTIITNVALGLLEDIGRFRHPLEFGFVPRLAGLKVTPPGKGFYGPKYNAPQIGSKVKG